MARLVPDRRRGGEWRDGRSPGARELVARIQDGDIQRVIVYRLDRLTRKLTDWALLADLFNRYDVGLTVVDGAIDTEAGSLARFQLNVLATFAELERDMIRERLADARGARAARGERSAGRVPLGYAADPGTKQLVVVETLRGLLDCELCGRAMTTSMSTRLTTKTATKAPRYYRCRTAGCSGGQIAAREVEAMALETLRRPQRQWPSAAKERLASFASTWDLLWPRNQRLALASVFETMTRRARTGRLLVKLYVGTSVEEPPVS